MSRGKFERALSNGDETTDHNKGILVEFFMMSSHRLVGPLVPPVSDFG